MRLSIQFYVWIILGDVNLLLIFISLTFELAILSQLISNMTASLTHPTPAILVENSITAYFLSASSTKKLAFFCNFSSNNNNFR